MTLEQKEAIINSIMMNEIKDNNLDINFYSCTRIQYFNSSFLRRIINNNNASTKLKLMKILAPLNSSGFFYSQDEERDIIIFLDKLSTIPGFSLPISRLLKNTYHELYHALQHKELNTPQENISFDLFASKCDIFLCSCQDSDFLKYYFSQETHDSQMFEILANLYGAKKTEEYLLGNNIPLTTKEIEQFNKQKEKYQQQYQNYDLTSRLNIILENYKKCIESKNFDKSIFELFVNDDGTLKDLNSVFSNEMVLNLDPRILIAFLKTDLIKNNIAQAELSDETTYKINELLSGGSVTTLEETENSKTI